jgi:hypothetical protein
MDAIVEAAKIGIAADRASNYCADAIGTSKVFGVMSAVSKTYRTGNSSAELSQIIKTDSE